MVGIVLADVDERVLFGELRERDAEPRTVVGIARHDHRLECRRRELVMRFLGPELADAVADPDLVEAPELRDCARGDRRALHGGPSLEHRDGRHLVLKAGAETQPIARANLP